MILSAHQPAYLPWLGYFNKIVRSDIFIFLDSVQFEKNSFTNRNKIKTAQGPIWLTVPLMTKGHINLVLEQMEIDNKRNWREKHFKSITQNYKKSPFIQHYYHKIEALYLKEYVFFAEICWDQLIFWLGEMGIHKKLVRSSDLPITSKKSDLILDLCRYFGADHYLSGALGRNYLEEDNFQQAGITIEYQDYQHPVYPQLWGDFVPFMGVVDFIMNTDNYWLITGEDRDEFLQRMG
jgi:hypothetical protein